MSHATIGRWGKSLGVRLPAEVARSLGLDVGSEVEITTGDGEIVVKPVVRKIRLEDLFADKSDAVWRALYRDSGFDWGPDVGCEIIDE